METKELKTPIEVIREFVLSSFENFIYYFQKEHSGYEPNLYPYQLKIVDKLEDVLSGKIPRLNINIPPRYRKTEIAVKNLIAYGLALNPKAKFIHLSYSKSLALDNSEAVKDLVSSAEYQALFPEVKIKKDSKAKEKWYTTAGGGVYATSAGGQVTGFGAGASPEEYENEEEEFSRNLDEFLSGTDDLSSEINLEKIGDELRLKLKFGGAIIIDDANKPEDADSPTALKKVNQRYDSTIKNRVNSRQTPIINIQQRIAKNDLSGHLEKQKGWESLVLPAISEDGEPLCEAIHTLEELQTIEEENDMVFAAQYRQKPKSAEGLMYEKIYRGELDYKFVRDNAEHLFSSTDANMSDGNDYFHTWFWAIYNGIPFIFDCIHEQFSAQKLKQTFIEKNTINSCQVAVIEQNNQQTFIGEVENKMPCQILPITSSSNKLSRMLAKRYLMKHVVFLYNADNPTYEKAIKHMAEFNKNGKSEDGHDDPEDAWTLGMDYIWVNYRHILID